VRVARSRWSRLRGLAFRERPPAEPLLIPRCRSVHTFGMRFALDLVWLGRGGRVLRIDRAVPPWRVRCCREAIEVLELAAGGADAIMPAMTEEARQEQGDEAQQEQGEEARQEQGDEARHDQGDETPREQTPTTPQTSPEEARGRMRAGLDPRQRLYRDPFNEYLVFILSAAGASVIAPVVLYVVMAITGIWAMVPFVLAVMAFELVLIFGVGRPQMKPVERVAWALLWAFAAGVLGLCFYYLVAESTL
jgi:uncharacterized membrane protein (UPF0127 family)